MKTFADGQMGMESSNVRRAWRTEAGVEKKKGEPFFWVMGVGVEDISKAVGRRVALLLVDLC